MAIAYPIPTPYQSPSMGGSPNIAPGKVGPAVSQDQVWNENWNKYWNIGYNAAQNTKGATPVYSYGNLPGARQGFEAGVQEYYKRYPVKSSGSATNSANKSNTPAPSPQSPSPQNTNPQPSGPSPDDIAYQKMIEEQNRLRNQISSGWDEYISSLDRQLNEGLPAQQGNLTGIVNNQFQQGLGSLGVSRDTGLTNLQGERESLEANQSKNLRDLAENLRNMFMAGNVYLGSRGAGDSSASNMYSYALGKVGTKARSDVMNQTSQQMAEIGRRETNLNTIYEQEKRNLETERDNKIYEIANWFETQKNALLSQKGQAGLQKSQDLANLTKDLLNQAMTALQNVQNQIAQRNQALDSWAISNAQNINQLKSNLQQVGTFKANLPQGQLTGGTPQISGGNVYTPINWSTNTSNEERDIWGNIIR